MHKTRLEAFSDGVLAIIITIMVLELKVPHGESLDTLKPLLPVFFSYVLSFIYVGIYWNNHHHMLHATHKVSGGVLWANLHLLFWLSLIPFTTAWMGEHPLSTAPVALYGFVLLMNAIAYSLLSMLLLRHEGPDSALARAYKRNLKDRISPALYVTGVVAAFFAPVVSLALYIVVAAIWIVPDRRIERALNVT